MLLLLTLVLLSIATSLPPNTQVPPAHALLCCQRVARWVSRCQHSHTTLKPPALLLLPTRVCLSDALALTC